MNIKNIFAFDQHRPEFFDDSVVVDAIVIRPLYRQVLY
jgi:hypothetical protein